jgi:hypothetical protein
MGGSSWSKQGRGTFFFLINGRIHYEAKKTYCGGSRLRCHPKNNCLANKESTHKYSPNISLVALCITLNSFDLKQKNKKKTRCFKLHAMECVGGASEIHLKKRN